MQSKLIYHIGAYNAKNAGDVVILDCVQRLFPEYEFLCREDRIAFNKGDITTINNYADLVLIGGGGLFLKDTAPNDVSGWRWNCSIPLLEEIEKPIAVLGVGYNRFRNQDDFIPVFSRHISTLVEKSSFFGLREKDGAILMSNYLEDELVKKVEYQPCPASFCGILHPEIKRKKAKRIIFAPAMDRVVLRYNGQEKQIFSEINKILESFYKGGYDILVACHCGGDITAMQYLNNNFSVVNISNWGAMEILELYSSAEFVFGMRLHSLVIPLGLGVPFMGIASHDKILRFASDIGHPEWSADITNIIPIDFPQENEILEARENQWKISQANIERLNEVINA